MKTQTTNQSETDLREPTEENQEMMMILKLNPEEEEEMTSLITGKQETIVLRKEIQILVTDEEEDSIEMMKIVSLLKEDQGIHLEIQEEMMKTDMRADNQTKPEDSCLMKSLKSKSLKQEKPSMILKLLKTTFL